MLSYCDVTIAACYGKGSTFRPKVPLVLTVACACVFGFVFGNAKKIKREWSFESAQWIPRSMDGVFFYAQYSFVVLNDGNQHMSARTNPKML